MNVNVQASEIEAAEPCLIGKRPIKRASKLKASFAELAAEYRAAYIIYNNTGLDLDDDVAKKYYVRTQDVERQMTKRSLPMNRSDEVTLVKIITDAVAGDGQSLEEAFADTPCGPFVIKLLNNIAASGRAVSASA
jgi:hypothetical protein